MEKIAISKFKATCLAVLERVRRTKKPILITRFGQPVAEVEVRRAGDHLPFDVLPPGAIGVLVRQAT